MHPPKKWFLIGGILTMLFLSSTIFSSANQVDADEKSKSKATSKSSKADSDSSKKDAARKEAEKKDTEKKDTTKKESSTASSEKEAAGKNSKSASNLPSPGRRLPAGYSALGLSDEQKEKIFKIRETHSKKLDSLQQQLDEQRAKMEKDFEGVLTDDQKEQLTSSKAESAKKSTDSARQSTDRQTS